MFMLCFLIIRISLWCLELMNKDSPYFVSIIEIIFVEMFPALRMDCNRKVSVAINYYRFSDQMLSFYVLK